MEDYPQSAFGLIFAAKDQITVLAMSGVAGAFFRVLIAPEKEWKRRIVQGLGGGLSALFLGGILGYLIDAATGAGGYAFAAGGFIMGSGGEVAVKKLQDRLIGEERSK